MSSPGGSASRPPSSSPSTSASAIGRYEADQEVQELLTASIGINLGVDFLPGSFGYDAGYSPDPEVAARVLWLDALTANVDRSWRNPNLLVWHGRLWAIDHGACLYFHHSWSGGSARRSASRGSRTTRPTTCWPRFAPVSRTPTPSWRPR